MSATTAQGTIVFLHGGDAGASWAKVEEIRRTFVAKYGDTDIDMLEGAQLGSAAELKALVETRPFFGVKRLVIVRGLSAARSPAIKKDVTDSLDRYRESPVVLVFHEARAFEKKDRTTAYFKKLSAEKYAHEFLPPTPGTLARKITATLAAEGVTMAPDAAALLAQDLVSDLRRVPMELAKLTDYKRGDATPITADDVELLVRPSVASNVFALADGLGAKDPAAMTREYLRLLANGDAGQRLLAMVVTHTRALLLARDGLDRGGTPDAVANTLSREVPLHPYVAKKSVQQARNFTREELTVLFHRLKELDVATKTGRAEADGALLDLLIETAR